MPEEEKKIRSLCNMKNKHIWIPVFALIGTGLIGLIASIIDFKAINKVEAYSYQTIQFNYNGASDGKDPNGNNFAPVSFLTDDIIQTALDKAELAGYDINEVRAHISIENVVPGNVIDEINSYEKLTETDGTRKITSRDYHPVRYRFCVYQGIDNKLPKTKLNGLLNNIVAEYCDKFYVTYKKSFDESAYEDLFNIDNYDYTYQSQIISTRLDVLMNYADEIYKTHNDFVVEGKSYRDLYLKAQSLISTDASKINNIIVLNALSKDAERLKNYYTYLIERLNYDKVKYQSDLTAISAQVADYEIDSTVYVGTGENVVKVESNSIETYNALLAKQIETSKKIADVEKQIAAYTETLDKLEHPVGSEAAEETAKAMIKQLNDDYGDLQELFKAMIEEYNKQYIRNVAVERGAMGHAKSSLFSSTFVVRAARNTTPLLLIALTGISIYYLVRAVRKEKKAA